MNETPTVGTVAVPECTRVSVAGFLFGWGSACRERRRKEEKEKDSRGELDDASFVVRLLHSRRAGYSYIDGILAHWLAQYLCVRKQKVHRRYDPFAWQRVN